MNKKRLDLLLLDRGYYSSRSRARAEIMAGKVLVEGRRCDKPGTPVPVEAEIALLPSDSPYVSRGGLKLEGACRDLGFSLKGEIVLDLGASTGGFTHFALRSGARRVYAVDVGYGQLDWSLRNDPRVVNLERTNARHLRSEHLEGEPPRVATIDVSFISIKKLLPVLARLPVCRVMALVKPQFEAGKHQVGKKGVVREAQTHREVLTGLMVFSREWGFEVKGVTFSRLKGPRGNIEYFIYLQRRGRPPCGAFSFKEEGGTFEPQHAGELYDNYRREAENVVRKAWAYFSS